jgi:hypothetical protein
LASFDYHTFAADSSALSVVAADSAAAAVAPAAAACPPPEAVYGEGSVLVPPLGTSSLPSARPLSTTMCEGYLALTLLFLFFIFSRHVRRFLALLADGVLSYRTAEKQFQGHLLSTAITFRVLTFFSVTVVGFFCWQLWPLTIAPWSDGVAAAAPFRYFVFLTGGLGGFLLLKAGLLQAIEYVGKSGEVLKTVIYFGHFSTIACGLMLLPVSLLTAAAIPDVFFGPLITIGITLVALCLLLYWLRVVQIFFHARLSIFFLILYLCTFEIVPIILIYYFISTS